MTDSPAKILVVDDEEQNVKLVEAILQPEGYEIVSASDGGEALARVASEQPDLILLDVMMPVLDGFEVCRRLRQQSDTELIPVVMMTALGQVEDRVKGIEAGADDFLTKPVNVDELLARIRTSIRSKKSVDNKVEALKDIQAYLTKFVPQAVRRVVADTAESPQLRKRDEDVSVLFLDISGYVRLSEALRQTADFMIERYFSLFFDCIQRHDGDVTETSGDGMMVVFTDPNPVESALKAIRAALEVMGKTTELNEQLSGIFDSLAVHIGINSGVATLGPTKLKGAHDELWTYTALGPVVNLAARIGAFADGGAILVGPETARRVASAVTLRDIGQHEFKNVKDAVSVYEVVSNNA